MNIAVILLAGLAGLLLGVVLTSVVGAAQAVKPLRARVQHLLERLEQESKRAQELELELARVKAAQEADKRAADERLQAIAEAERRLVETFRSLATQALNENSTAFLQTADLQFKTLRQEAQFDLEQRRTAVEGMVKPIGEALEKVEAKIQELEKARSEAYGGLMAQVRGLSQSQTELRSETQKLVQALRAPAVRGRWGEVQLQRVVEIAGMVEHCDFTTQEHLTNGGSARRPDMIVHLPNSRSIVIDSKVPLEHYLNALECTEDGQKTALLADHARQVRRHIQELGSKSYWDALEHTPEVVVLFLPGEVFYSAALEQDPQLIEYGVDQRVLIATPTTLIGLLKAIAYGWRQEQVAQSAAEVASLGKDLYERLRVVGENFSRVGKALQRATESYNKAAGSLESRFLVTARKFRDLGVTGANELPELSVVEVTPRALQAPEFLLRAEEVPEEDAPQEEVAEVEESEKLQEALD